MVTRRAFTLLEVLLAIILAAVVLALLSTLLVTFSEVWHQRRAGDPFQEHVAGLRTFLQSAIDRSESPDPASGQANAARGEATVVGRITWSRPPGVGDYEEPLLGFALEDAPPVLLAGAPPLPGITLWLSLKPESGLAVVFLSRLALEGGEEEDLFHRVLSPWLSSVSYAVYDPENDSWEETPEPPKDDSRNPLVPDAVILGFKSPAGDEATITLHLPVSSTDALLP